MDCRSSRFSSSGPFLQTQTINNFLNAQGDNRLRGGGTDAGCFAEDVFRLTAALFSSHACSDPSHLYSHCKTGGCKGPVISIKHQTPGSA